MASYHDLDRIRDLLKTQFSSERELWDWLLGHLEKRGRWSRNVCPGIPLDATTSKYQDLLQKQAQSHWPLAFVIWWKGCWLLVRGDVTDRSYCELGRTYIEASNEIERLIATSQEEALRRELQTLADRAMGEGSGACTVFRDADGIWRVEGYRDIYGATWLDRWSRVDYFQAPFELSFGHDVEALRGFLSDIITNRATKAESIDCHPAMFPEGEADLDETRDLDEYMDEYDEDE